MPKFNHAYSIAFEVVSEEEDGDDVTNDMIAVAVLRRVAALIESREKCPIVGESLTEACGAPYDTYREE